MGQLRISANLAILWSDRPLPEAIRAAGRAGFDAVECHWPYEVAPALVRDALEETGLPMLGLNTIRGEEGQNGLCALPGREADAKASIDDAIDYANSVDAGGIHVMAGFSDGAEAHQTFVENLKYAAGATDRMILIEPLNRHDAPGYFLKTTDQARSIIEEVSAPNIKLMFDCYHVGRTEGDVVTRLKDLLGVVGHIQFASVPDRGAPDHGELNYDAIFRSISEIGWSRPIGAEYKPGGTTEKTLDWLSKAKRF